MKRVWIQILPVLLPACMVDTPVVEGTPEERLTEDIESWCATACVKLDDCGMSDSPETCPDDCVSFFTETFTGHGNECASAGLRVRNCLDDASCAELMQEDACNITAEERHCSEDQDLVSCNAESSGAGPNGSPFMCDMSLEECSDGNVYGFWCGGDEVHPECVCTSNGSEVGRYQPAVLECPTANQWTRICGFPIAQSGTDPDSPPPPARCTLGGSTGSAGGGPVGECEIWSDDCSDGRYYSVQCQDSVCRCMIDGAPLGFFGTSDAICPYALQGDNGVIAMNYSCGFSIQTVYSK